MLEHGEPDLLPPPNAGPLSRNIGFIGLGLLGLPMALAFASRGHRVRGFDADPRRMGPGWYPVPEHGLEGETLAEMASRTGLTFSPLEEVVTDSEIIFVAVQTPSATGYDGTTPFPSGGSEYDLGPLRAALSAATCAAERASPAERVVAVASTVLPGTLRELASLLTPASGLALAYTPVFAAVGSVIADLLDPEFVLIGTARPDAGRRLKEFFGTVTNAPIFCTALESAELVKTSYNGYIGLKIAFANALMELAHHIPGCDVDEVVDCLALATRRLMSPRYLRGGLGDGGGCHPKENAALAALARRVGLSFDPFGTNLEARDRQTEWLAQLVEREHRQTGLPIWVLGTAFKAEVTVEYGSPALLLLTALRRRGMRPAMHDPLVPGRWNPPPAAAALFVLAVPHQALRDIEVARGSVVVDPWRQFRARDGVRVIALGRGAHVP